MGRKYLIKGRDQGFSMVESLIAIVVLGIVMAGGMAFYFYSKTLYYRGLHSQLAAWIVDSKMEEIKATGCSNALTDPGTTVGLSGNWLDTNRLTGTRTVLWPVSTTKPIPCVVSNDVIVQVVWQEPGETSNRTVNAETWVGF